MGEKGKKLGKNAEPGPMLQLFWIAHSFKATAFENGERKALKHVLSDVVFFLIIQRFFCPAACFYFVTTPMKPRLLGKWRIVGDAGQVPYDFGPNFKKGFLAKEQATRTFEIIISLDFFLNSQIFLMMDTLVTALGKVSYE